LKINRKAEQDNQLGNRTDAVVSIKRHRSSSRRNMRTKMGKREKRKIKRRHGSNQEHKWK